MRKLLLAFIEIHILHHASKDPIYGSWMIDELKHHGYEVSAGTIYPIFHNLEAGGLLTCEVRNVGGKNRKYYSITEDGREVLAKAKEKIKELTHEL